MKIIDNMPIAIVIAALLLNITIGIYSGVNFTALMIRCIIVTIIFGVFGYMVTKTVVNAIECSKLSTKHIHSKSDGPDGMQDSDIPNKPMLDIKVPPLDDEEFISVDNDSNNEFVEVNPVFMGKYNSEEQD